MPPPSAVTPERFARGMTFDVYVRYAGSPENLAREAWGGYFPDGGSYGAPRQDQSGVLRERYARTRLTDHQAGGLELRIFPRDGKKILGTAAPTPPPPPTPTTTSCWSS